MADDTLLTRLTRLEDIGALRSLSARYALAIDTRDYAALAEMFTTDAIFGGTSDGAGAIAGRALIVASLRERLDATGATYHCVHDIVSVFHPNDPDYASGIVTTHAETRTGGAVAIKAVRYMDEYRRDKGGWRFHRRMLSFPMESVA